MDDGAKDNARMTIQTHSFSNREVYCLQKCLEKNFGITTNIRRNKNRDILYIPKKQIEKLYHLVENHLLPEYKYKFPLTP